MSVSNFINSWLKDIVVLFIFISIVDLIVAKGTMKRYIDFVIGLLVIFTVINPFLKLTRINFNLDQAVMKHLDTSSITIAEKMDKEADSNIEKIYISKVSNEITRLIQEGSNYAVTNIYLDVEKGKDLGEIKSVEILLTNRKDENEKNTKNKISVKKIDAISVGKEIKAVEKENPVDNYENIKQILFDNLNIDKGLISIKLQDEED